MYDCSVEPGGVETTRDHEEENQDNLAGALEETIDQSGKFGQEVVVALQLGLVHEPEHHPDQADDGGNHWVEEEKQGDFDRQQPGGNWGVAAETDDGQVDDVKKRRHVVSQYDEVAFRSEAPESDLVNHSEDLLLFLPAVHELGEAHVRADVAEAEYEADSDEEDDGRAVWEALVEDSVKETVVR